MLHNILLESLGSISIEWKYRAGGVGKPSKPLPAAQHPIPTVSLVIQLPANAPGKAVKIDPSTWALVSMWETPVVVAICGGNQQMEDFCNSDFQIDKLTSKCYADLFT